MTRKEIAKKLVEVLPAEFFKRDLHLKIDIEGQKTKNLFFY